jgi:hypothetical protein
VYPSQENLGLWLTTGFIYFLHLYSDIKISQSSLYPTTKMARMVVKLPREKKKLVTEKKKKNLI